MTNITYLLIGSLVATLHGTWPGGHESFYSQERDVAIQMDTRTASGKLIAEGLNKTPVGPYGLLTYKLEEVELPASANQNTAESSVKRKTTLRLTITGRSLETVNKVWLGDFLLPTVWSHGPSKIGIFINDPSMLGDDSDISIVDGKGEIHPLPERLKLPQSFKAFQKPEKIEEGNQVVSVRSGLKVHGSRQQRIVMIEMRTARGLPIINSVYYAQIGRKFFELGGQGRRWVVELTDQEFAELKDGDRVAIGIGIVNIAYLGRLNKSMLDR
jgi:hypothetical protein